MSNEHPPLSPDDTMPFGKYQGTEVWALMEDDPEYVRWLIQNTDVQFDDKAFQMYRDNLHPSHNRR